MIFAITSGTFLVRPVYDMVGEATEGYMYHSGFPGFRDSRSEGKTDSDLYA